MPELPEVQTTINQIRDQILGREIKKLVVTDKGLRLIRPYTSEQLEGLLTGESITEIDRHGKYMIFRLLGGSAVIAHLRMSGRFLLTPTPSKHIHNRLYLELQSGPVLNFVDTRRFATFTFVRSSQRESEILPSGVDALSEEFTSSYLREILENRSKSIYSALMDQSIVAGIGNIYANEILWASKINPSISSGTVAQDKLTLQNIVSNSKAILRKAINYKGTTLIDKSFKDATDSSGEFFNELEVYGRIDERCSKCEQTIQKGKISGRSVYFCPECQR